ncbi:hypothetical protein Scep_001672 [Stephania cephalantha]|uniref:Uncharacterized protein n=1 Tax=Stephania cephalantha TaxID=152367 RepID=A0AAP0Q7Z6_9MAGN
MLRPPPPRTAASHRGLAPHRPTGPAFAASTVTNSPLLRPPPPPTSPASTASTVADSQSRFGGDQHPSPSPLTTTYRRRLLPRTTGRPQPPPSPPSSRWMYFFDGLVLELKYAAYTIYSQQWCWLAGHNVLVHCRDCGTSTAEADNRR